MPKTTSATTPTVYENKKKRAQKVYQKVIELRENEGLSYSTIASKLKIAKTSVYRHLARSKKSIPVEEIKSQGRPQKITPRLRQDRLWDNLWQGVMFQRLKH